MVLDGHPSWRREIPDDIPGPTLSAKVYLGIDWEQRAWKLVGRTWKKYESKKKQEKNNRTEKPYGDKRRNAFLRNQTLDEWENEKRSHIELARKCPREMWTFREGWLGANSRDLWEFENDNLGGEIWWVVKRFNSRLTKFTHGCLDREGQSPSSWKDRRFSMPPWTRKEPVIPGLEGHMFPVQ